MARKPEHGTSAAPKSSNRLRNPNEGNGSSARFEQMIREGGWHHDFASWRFVDYILKRNPKEILRFYNMAPAGKEKDDMYRLLVPGWFGADPAGFIEWASNSHASKEEYDRLLEAIAHVGFSMLRNPRPDGYLKTIKTLASRANDPRSKQAIDDLEIHILSAFADSNDTRSLVSMLKNGENAEMIDRALGRRAMIQPDEVVEYLKQSSMRVPDVVAKGLVESDLFAGDENHSAALRRYLDHGWTEEGTRVDVARLLMKSLLEQDSLLASQHIRELAPGPNRDALILGMIRWLCDKSAENEARNWLPAIKDENIRSKAASHLK